MKPVAFINVEERKLEWAEPMTWNTPTIVRMDKIPLYTKPNDEPAAWFYYRPGETGKFMCADAEAMKGIEKDGWVTTPLYAHSVKELTDEEITELSKILLVFSHPDKLFKNDKNFHQYQLDFARAILEKASEK